MNSIYQSIRSISAGLLIVFFLSLLNVYGQSQKTKQIKKPSKQEVILKEQTSFSSEGKISNRVKLPANILKQLSDYDSGRLAQCQQDEYTRKSNIAEHFAASQININRDGRTDLIVQAQSPCFMGAHNTTFWLFINANQKSGGKYQMVFDISVDFLKILKTASNGYRDIETASHTAVELYTIKWKYDGQKYQKSECRLTDEKNKTSKIDCNF